MKLHAHIRKDIYFISTPDRNEPFEGLSFVDDRFLFETTHSFDRSQFDILDRDRV